MASLSYVSGIIRGLILFTLWQRDIQTNTKFNKLSPLKNVKDTTSLSTAMHAISCNKMKKEQQPIFHPEILVQINSAYILAYRMFNEQLCTRSNARE